MLDPSCLYSALVGIKGPSVGSQLLVPGGETACVGTVQVYQSVQGPCQRPGGACCTLARLHAVTWHSQEAARLRNRVHVCLYVCWYSQEAARLRNREKDITVHFNVTREENITASRNQTRPEKPSNGVSAKYILPY